MSRISELQEKLLDTNAAIAELDKAIAKDPKSQPLTAMAKSLEKRYQKLETEFMDAVDSLGIDVCSYRLFSEEEQQPTLKGFSNVLGDFQNLVTTVYASIKMAVPKIRAKISADIAAETVFRFGYTYPGSLGVVFTIPNERKLFGESFLDESLKIIAEMAKLHESPEVLEYAKKLGPASIRALYRWAYDHAESGLGVEIEWRRQRIIHTHMFAQKPDFQRLHQIISFTSDEQTCEETVSADLVGIDVAKNTFHLELDTGEDIKGSLSDIMAETIDEKHPAKLPKRYKAKYRKIRRILYSTDEEKTSYHLLSLEPLT